jgi:hypothetical protein
MDDLLKDAIADAKAVRETALANAKMALEEAFTPKLKSMLAKKIQSEIEDEDGDEVEEQDELSDEDDVVDPASDEEGGPVSEDESEDGEEVDEAEVPDDEEAAEDPISTEGEHEDEDDEPVAEEDEMSDEDDEEAVAEEDEMSDEDDEELDLEAILRELEDEDEDEVSEEFEADDAEDDEEAVSENDVSSDIGKADNKVADAAADSSKTGAQGPEGEGSDSEAGKENSEDEVVKEEDEVSDEDDDIDLEEVLKALSEEDDEDEADAEVEENAVLKAEIKEHRDVVKYLRAKLNEVNLLNAKLLFSNKLFRVFGLSNEQKMKVVETFDRTKNIREIKLVYSTLAESFKGARGPVKESKGSSSKAVASTKPSKKVISEGSDVKARFKKLANII